MKKVIELLADPYCERFRPLTIDYDLIKVNNSICWSLKKSYLVEDAIEAHQVGKVSPRAFCPYDPTQKPDTKYFREILENTLSPRGHIGIDSAKILSNCCTTTKKKVHGQSSVFDR